MPPADRGAGTPADSDTEQEPVVVEVAPVEDDRPDRHSADQPSGPRPHSAAVRITVATVAVLAVLLLGAAAGLLIGLPGSDQAAPAPDSVDVGFAQDMSVHHLQATEMSTVARERSTDRFIRGIAFDIESTQLEQVGRMKGWLSLWQRPEQAAHGKYMAWMTGPEGHGHGASQTAAAGPTYLMPGMATQAEMARLRTLTGEEFDVFFLQLMLRHHQGGSEMAEYGSKTAQIGVVRNLAKAILTSQTAETELLKKELAKRNAQPLPPPN